MGSGGRTYSVAVVGATGVVGREFLRILEERRFPLGDLRLLATSRSAGKAVRAMGRDLTVEETRPEAFRGMDFVFLSATDEASRRYAPLAVEAGAVVLDDSGAWRMEPDVPLVVPEVNGEDLAGHRGIIATPNCTTTPLVMALWPLHQVNPVRRVVVDTYQSVSGTGGAAVEELTAQTRAAVLDQPVPAPEQYPHRIAFNLLPQVGSFLENAYCKEEMKIVNETRKIMHAPDLAISATTVRVPVYFAHSEAVHVELSRPMEAEEARRLMAAMPGVRVVDDPAARAYPMPLDATGRDEVLVGRVRRDISHPSGLALWISCDNIRKGAALNVVQIMEELIARELV
ncbi:MAG TPA: aspartate-semialdehyde dehydrogenase [Dehalococcoidia bacterium]